MTKKKKTWIIIGAIFSSMFLTVILLLILGFPWTLMYIGYQLEEDPPQPVVSYAEFPFELVYEINGERIEIKDTLVIEHKGTDWNEGLGKHNMWSVYYKSLQTTNKDLELFDGFVDDVGSVSIYYELGSCEYYFGLEETDPFYKYHASAGDIVVYSSDYTGTISDQELYEKYNIKIIKKSISPPINPEDYSS